ncbi:hypothetical protein Vafri_976, partial [Volvox africanus]
VAFRVPPALDPVASPAEAAAATAAGLPLESISASFVARVDRLFPLMCSQLMLLADAPKALARDAELHGRHRRWSYGSDDDDSDELHLGGCGANGGQADLYRELLALLAETCLGWFRHPAEAVARVGLSSLSRLLEVTGGVVLPSPSAAEGSSPAPASSGSALQQQQQHLQRGWDVLIPLLSSTLGLELDLITQFAVRLRSQQQQQQQQQQAADLSVAAVTPRPLFTAGRPALDPEGRRLRCRCRMAVLLQRTLCEHTARRAEQLPWSVTHQLVVLLVGLVRRLMTFNMREDLPPQVLMEQQQQLLKLQGGRQMELQGKSEEDFGTGKNPAGADAAAAPVGESAAAAAADGDGWGEGWDDGWDDGEADGKGLPGELGTCVEVGSRQEHGSEDGDGMDDGMGLNGGLAGVHSLKSPVSTGEDATELSSSSSVEAAQGGADKAAKLQPEDAAGVATAEGHESDETEAPTVIATVPVTADAEAGAAAQAAEVPAAAPGPALPGARLKLSGPHLQLTSATSHDGMRPALARLEVEAADAAITLLLSCAETASPSADVERRREACVQLEALCRHIITCSVAAHTLAATTAMSSSGMRHAASLDSPQEPAALDPNLPGSSWDHAVRAAVLARAIRVMLMLGTLEGDKSTAAVGAAGGAAAEHHQNRQLALLPDVLALLRSHQPVVRGAVADYLERVVGPRLQRLLAL